MTLLEFICVLEHLKELNRDICRTAEIIEITDESDYYLIKTSNGNIRLFSDFFEWC